MPVDETFAAFRDKWLNNPDATFRATLTEGSTLQRWILARNGFAGPREFAEWLSGRKRILDAGCGNGRVTALLAMHAPADCEICGIDFASAAVATANLSDHANVQIAERDLLEDLSDLGRFDLIYCQEVLHHTKDPRRAFANLAGLLAPGGEIAIYVYKVKAPVREFTDDFLRAKLAGLPYEDAMQVARALTELGKRLSAIEQEITVPAIDPLGIPAGTYPVQRLVYHFFMKCFWNGELSFEENAVINFDWYRPQLASRHTLAEVRGWFEACGLAIRHECVDEYGITLRGRSGDAGRN